ncbi:MAG: phosphopantetheine-binding protein [Bacteroidales bacterium]
MEERIKNIIAAVFEIEKSKIKNNILLTDIENYDSLRFINFLTALEEEFDCNFEYEEIQNLKSFNEILSYITKLKSR